MGTLAAMAVDAAIAVRARVIARREALVSAGIAAVIGLLLAALGPPAGDGAAHVYRLELLREGVLVWDGFWYGGHYPLASYSLLGYLPALLVGAVPSVLAATVLAAALFAAIAVGEWGDAARWPARAFAVAASAPVFTGTYTYALGLAAALGAVWAMQQARRWLFLACAALTIGFSPLAFLFLCLVCLSVAIVRRPPVSAALPLGLGLAALGGLWLAFARVFPSEQRYAFRLQELAWALLACAGIALVAWRDRRARVLGVLFILLGAASVLAFALDSPVGSTVTRFRAYVFPMALLVVLVTRMRPRWIAASALAVALFYSVSQYLFVAPPLTDSRAAASSFWAPTATYLRGRLDPGERVDVIPTFDNWEAYYLPRAGIPIARGWFRQLDLARNPVLYEHDLTGAEYRAWLRGLSVRYVVLPLAPLDRVGAEPQAELLRSGRSGLVKVARFPQAIVYELPGATPLLTGPGSPRLTAFEHARIAGVLEQPGAHLLRVRWTPYLAVRRGDMCLAPDPNGMTRIVARSAGPFELAVPGAGDLLRRALGARPDRCA